MNNNLGDQIISLFLQQSVALFIVYFLVLVAIASDLISGVRKAKASGTYRSSQKYRRTACKTGKYYAGLFAVTTVDFMQIVALFHFELQGGMHIPQFPILTYAAAILIGLNELKSIFESSEDKDKAKVKEAVNLLVEIAKHKDAADVIDNITKYVTQQNKKE